MPGGLKHVGAVATALFFVVLAVPALALAHSASKCHASACQVYVEPNAPSAAGGHSSHTTPPPKNPSSSSSDTGSPTKVARVLAHAGPNKNALTRLLGDPGASTLRSPAVAIIGPSALGAAFDLGTGPTILLAVLLASAVALAVHSGVRGWRHRRSAV